MNSGRFWLIVATLAGTTATLSGGCGESAAPCTTCPPIEGRYALEYGAGTIPPDCTALAVALPEGPLDIQRVGSQLSGSVDGVALQGTVFSTYDFSLVSTVGPTDGGTDTLSFSGRYASARGDGGTGQLAGSFSGTYSRNTPQGTRRCSLTRPFTATQQGQP